jgi:centromeric protein E
LHGQNSLLERDISKRDSLAGRRRDSIAEKSSKMFDPQRPKGPAFSLVEDLINICLQEMWLLLII